MKYFSIIKIISVVLIIGAIGSGVVAYGWENPQGGELEDFFGGPKKNRIAPGFKLKTLDGQTVTIPDDGRGQPIVLEFGSYTCPIFRKNHESMEVLYKEYGDRVKFFLIYTVEAHPKNNACPYRISTWVTEPNQRQGILYDQPKSEGLRKDIARDAKEALNITIPILIDDMRNSVWNTYGRAPNAAYLIGENGKIKLRQGWYKPDKFEKALKRELRIK